MKQRHNSKLIPNTNITVKEFKELAFKKFKAYLDMRRFRNEQHVSWEKETDYK